MRDRAERLPGLDAARALAVLAMVVGHTADALLSDAARALPWVQVYWGFRGLTAPLFLVVSGWAVIAAAGRRGISGRALLRDRLGRIAALLVCGLVLRWPGWDVPGFFALDPTVWKHLLGFDALQCIACCLLAAVACLAMAPGFTTRALALGMIALIVPLASSAVHTAVASIQPPFPVHLALVPDTASPFALFPWAGYFFAGALAGHLLPLVSGKLLRAAALLCAGAAMVSLATIAGIDWSTSASPTHVALRLGHVLEILGGVMLVPAVASTRMAPLGRSALVVYVSHLPIVYGWSTFDGLAAFWGRSLRPWQVIAVAACLLAFGLGLAAALRWTKANLRSARLRLEVPTPAPSATGEPPR